MKYLIPIILFITYSFTLIPDKSDKKYYTENYRPQYHFTPEKNWMSAPCGLVYYDGEYHLFYQYNLSDLDLDNQHWSHAKSKDLVRWEHLPIAITPEEESQSQGTPAALAGSAIVDFNNTAGLQVGEEKTLLIFYTGNEIGQRLAYSNDKGQTWKKYDKNPVIPFDNDNGAFPKVFYYQPTQTWVMALSRTPERDKPQQGVSFYTSKNLTNWTFQSHISGFSGAPDLFELPVDGDSKNIKWVLIGGDGAYFVGKFDGKTFTPEGRRKIIDYGNNFYAPQTWSNTPDKKVVQIAWMKGGAFPDMPFNGQMTFPCDLSLRSTSEGIVLCKLPIAAITTLAEKGLVKKEKNIIPGINGNLISGISGDAIHIKATIEPKNSDGFGFLIRNGKKEIGTEIRYDTNKKVLDCLGKEVPLSTKDGKIQLEILVDRSSIEIFANGGEEVISSCFTPNLNENGLTLWTQGGEIFVNQIEVFKIKSAWGEK